MIWLVVAIVLTFVGSAEAAVKYATNDGATSGTCSTSGTACRLDYLLATAAAGVVANCGDTVNLVSGTYQGANNMLNLDPTTAGLTVAHPVCTAGNELTIQAETDGGVFFDGQFARFPFLLNGQQYWIFQGFDVGNSNHAVGIIYEAHHSQFKRLCFSNTNGTTANDHVLWFWSTANALVEDVCAFGRGRNTFLTYCDSACLTNTNGNTFRRMWLRYEGFPAPNDAMPVQLNYNSAGTTVGGNIYENIIVVWDPEQETVSATTRLMAFHRDANNAADQLKGWIIYGYTGSQQPNFTFYRDNASGADNAAIRNLVDIFSDSRSSSSSSSGSFFLSCTVGARCASNSADRFTGIINGSNGAMNITNWANKTNTGNECTSLASCPDFYTGTLGGASGARNCFRYSGGTLSSTPLWPWPMDDRIKAALARAKAAGTGGSDLSGTALAGAYAAGTVTSEIVSRYGSVPTACLTSSSFTPSFPVASDFPSVSIRDDFNRADAPTLGAGWTELLSDTFSIVSNAASAPSTGGAFARTTYSDTKMQTSHEVYATWTVLPATGGYTTMLSFAGTDLTVNNQYRVRVNRTSSANSLLEVRRVDGVGTETVIMAGVDLGIEAVDTNSFGVRVSGTTISVYWKWTDGIWYRVGQFTDSNLSTLPSSGVYGGVAGGSPAVIDNYGAGPFVDQPVQEPPSPPASTGAGRFGTTFPGVR